MAMSGPFKPTLAVIVPAFNEQDHVAVCVRRILEAMRDCDQSTQLILVNDGSKDATTEILRSLAVEFPFTTLIEHDTNRGKGMAIRTGLESVTADWVVIHDADQEYDPRDLSILLDRMRHGDADVVYGSRCMPGSTNPRRFNAFGWGVSLLNVIVRLLYRVRLSDEATCYKLFHTDDLRRMDLQCERFEFCPEVTAKAVRLGLRIAEVPISYRPRSLQEGKKIGWRDGWEAIGTLWRYRNWQGPGKATADASQVNQGTNACNRPHLLDTRHPGRTERSDQSAL